ncbi:MAG: DNA-binding protein Alba [Candidatus Micrarchaeia archaeon]|jgi:DNA-binding protein
MAEDSQANAASDSMASCSPQAEGEEVCASQPGGLKPDDNTVFVGRKPPMSYVTAVVTRFNNGSPEVRLKARGKSICLAVDVTQIVKRKFYPEMKIDNVVIDTEELPSEDGRMSRVSSMTIFLSK